MTNKEKAVGISLQVRDLCIEKGVTRDNAETASLLVQQATLQMAEWKDKRVKLCFILIANLIKDGVFTKDNIEHIMVKQMMELYNNQKI